MRRCVPIGIGLSALSLAVAFVSPAAAATGWQAPQRISKSLESVSCSGPTFCMAVNPLGKSYTFHGSAWSSRIKIMPAVDGGRLSCLSGDVLPRGRRLV